MLNILEYKFSIFGNFEKIINNIQTIANTMSEFNKGTSNIPGPYGPQLLYFFISKNVTFQVSLNRIDFVFSGFKPDDIEQVSDIINKIDPSLFDSINRLAINYSSFERNNYQEKINILSEKLKLLNLTDECKEVFISYNYKSIVKNTRLNNIVSIQNSMIQDSKTFESFPAIMLSLDINTEVSTSIKFDVNDIKDYFEEFKKMSESEIEELMKKVEIKL